MPGLSRWLVRTAFIHLALALGTVLAWPSALARWPALLRAAPVQLHLFVVGWITRLIAGVAYWFFPRIVREAVPGDPRGWWVYVALDLELILRATAEPWAGPADAGPQRIGCSPSTHPVPSAEPRPRWPPRGTRGMAESCSCGPAPRRSSGGPPSSARWCSLR